MNHHDQDLQDEWGADMGDPRRCPVHPNEKTSSNDGMHDAPCSACEWEMDQHAADRETAKV